jgi:hypothetical protein
VIYDYSHSDIQKLSVTGRRNMEQGLCPKCGDGRFVRVDNAISQGLKSISASASLLSCVTCRYMTNTIIFGPRRIVTTDGLDEDPLPDIASKIQAIDFTRISERPPVKKRRTQKARLIPLIGGCCLVLLLLITGVYFVFLRNGGDAFPEEILDYYPVDFSYPQTAEAMEEESVSIITRDEIEDGEEIEEDEPEEQVLPPPVVIPPHPEVPLERNLATNDEAKVILLQERLNELSMYDGDPLVVDGRFGPLTQAAVMNFQRRVGGPTDGIVTPWLWEQLFIRLD